MLAHVPGITRFGCPLGQDSPALLHDLTEHRPIRRRPLPVPRFQTTHHTFVSQAQPQDPLLHEMNQHNLDMDDTQPPLPGDITEIDTILSGYESFFSDESGDVPIPVPLLWLSPKVHILVDILRESALSSFQGIIFVEQRQVASCLAKILPQIPELQGLIRCAELVGHGGANSGSMQARGMGLARQNDVVQLFRDKEINLRE